MDSNSYFSIFYVGSRYDYDDNQRIAETFSAFYTNSRSELTDHIASFVAIEGRDDYSILVDGVLVCDPVGNVLTHHIDENEKNLLPYEIPASGIGEELSQEIKKKVLAIKSREQAERVKHDEMKRQERALNKEATERKKLGELLAKYGSSDKW